MSNLRIYVDNSDHSLQVPAPASCGEEPPAVPAHGPRSADTCRISLPLTLDVPQPPAPRQVVFERVGDQFILSPQNSADTLAWVSANQNLPVVTDTLRMTAGMLRNFGRRAAADRFTLGFFLWMSRYVMTGQIRHDGNDHTPFDQTDVEGFLLDFFTGSLSRGLVTIVGNLNLQRREARLSEEARERIRRLTGILDLVPTYLAFVDHFVSEAERNNVGSLSSPDFTRLGQIYMFIRRTVVALSQHRPLRYDAVAMNAVRAYQQLHQADIAAGNRPDFCTALQAAVEPSGETGGPTPNFINECRSGIELAERPNEEALRESLRSSLVNPAGLQLLQQAISGESQRANMRIDWLHARGSFGQVFSSILENIQVQAPSSPEGATTLSFNVAEFTRRLRLMTVLGTRGEYDLAALAFLRRIFGTEGNPPRVRAFADGFFQEVEWRLSETDLRAVRELADSLTSRRQSSASFANVGNPLILGTSCALGIGGLIVSHTVPLITSNREIQLGLGTTSAGLAGGGCLGFTGHYVWPRAVPRAVHNPYAWDFGTAAVGTGIGIGTYLLINLLTAGQPMNMDPALRFPVDSFGP